MVVLNVIGAKLLLKQLRAVRYKKPYTLATPPPWSKLRDYLAGRRPAQVTVNEAFKKAATMTAGLALADRMEIISYAMKGKSFGGKKRVVYTRMSSAELERKKAEVEAAIKALAKG
jgi:hypothetical protein